MRKQKASLDSVTRSDDRTVRRALAK